MVARRAPASLSFESEGIEAMATAPTAAKEQTAVNEGLEDVIAGKSAICEVNGTEGRLIYQGYDINDLAQHSTFEETTYLLWHGALPTRAQLTELEQQLEQNRALPAEVIDLMRRLPRKS